MFPLSITRLLLVESIAQKEQFAEDLAASLSVKFYSARILQGDDGPSISFPKGFSSALINFKWLEGESIEINHQTEPVQVEYEVFFTYTFFVFCLVNFSLLILFFTKAFEWQILFFLISLTWTLYGIMVKLTAFVFKIRIGKSIREVQQTQESISQKQLEWIHNEHQCPACGYSITQYTQVCPDCQLNLH